MDDLNQIICERFAMVNRIKEKYPEFVETIKYDESHYAYCHVMGKSDEETAQMYDEFLESLDHDLRISIYLFRGLLLGLEEENYNDKDMKEQIELCYEVAEKEFK